MNEGVVDARFRLGLVLSAQRSYGGGVTLRRILFVNHVSRVSGAERSLLDLLRHLDRGRFEPLVCLPPGGELTEALPATGAPAYHVPLRRLRRTANPLRLAGDLAHAAWVIRRLARLIRDERIDIVHANSDTAQLYAGPAARWAVVPCVWHTRDLAPLGALGWWLERYASRVVAISDGVRRRVQPCVRPASKLRRLYNGIDLEGLAIRGDGSATRAELGLPADVPVVAMMGQMVPWKGQGAFIEMAACLGRTLPPLRFVIVGGDLFDEHPRYVAALRARSDELGLRDRILFTGYRADAVRLLDAVDVLVHPATREPLGRVILEAMAKGKPVVAVNAGGPAEIIRNGVDGLLAESDRADDLAQAVLRVIGDPMLAAQLGAAARRRVAECFNIRDRVRDIEALYDELLPPGGPPCA